MSEGCEAIGLASVKHPSILHNGGSSSRQANWDSSLMTREKVTRSGMVSGSQHQCMTPVESLGHGAAFATRECAERNCRALSAQSKRIGPLASSTVVIIYLTIWGGRSRKRVQLESQCWRSINCNPSALLAAETLCPCDDRHGWMQHGFYVCSSMQYLVRAMQRTGRLASI